MGLPTILAISASLLVMIVDSFAVRVLLMVSIFVLFIIAGRVLLMRKRRGAGGDKSGSENTAGRT